MHFLNLDAGNASEMGDSPHTALIGGPQVVNLALSLAKKVIQLGLLSIETSFQGSRGDVSMGCDEQVYLVLFETRCHYRPNEKVCT